MSGWRDGVAMGCGACGGEGGGAQVMAFCGGVATNGWWHQGYKLLDVQVA